MDKLKDIERYVLQGLVLDMKGSWRPVDEVTAEEIEYLQHLEKGEVLKKGRWITLDAVFKRESPGQKQQGAGEKKTAEAPHAATPSVGPDMDAGASAQKESAVVQSDTDHAIPEESPRPTDTVILDMSSPQKDQERDTDRIPVVTRPDAVNDDAETKGSDVPSAQMEPPKTKLLDKEALGIRESQPVEESDDELLSVDEFETMITKMENADTGKEDNNLSPAPDSHPPSSHSPLRPSRQSTNAAPPVAGDEWDTARSRNVKVIIGSIAGGIIIAILLILKFLL